MLKRISLLHFCNEDKATSWQRSEAFKNLNVEYSILYHNLLVNDNKFLQRLIQSIFHKLQIPLENNDENIKLIKVLSEKKYDVIFIEKCLTLKPKTLQFIKKKWPSTKLILYVLDDFLGKGNKSLYFKNCIPMFDLIATNKNHNIAEYINLGAKKVYYFKNAFSKIVHRPINLALGEKEYYGSDVTFIGTFEKKRANYMLYLAENNIKIKVWGWSKSSNKSGILHPNITNMNKHVYSDEFAKVISSSKICLNFLRDSNRDTETTRSIEIPACKGFMLAERTEQHQLLFKEDIEAVYFSNKEELLEKVTYFLVSPTHRLSIAHAGYLRCMNQDYSYENQLNIILNQINQ